MALPIRFTKPDPLTLLRLSLFLSAVLMAGAVAQFQAQVIAEELFFTSTSFKLALYVGYALAGMLAIAAILAWTPLATRMKAGLQGFQQTLQRLGPVALVAFVLILVAYPLVILGFYGRFLTGFFTRLMAFWAAGALVATLWAAWSKKDWVAALPVGLMSVGAVYLASTFLYMVRAYPFSLEWSEISRYYQASFFFSQQVYGTTLPLPVTHPSRYVLQSLPFLIPGSMLWMHRLWQALLWIGMPLITAWALARRLRIEAKSLRWLFIVWAALFLMQGAVFYHLLPCVILILLGFDKDRPWRSLLFVALASAWAGISRINWAPLPGALAALLYLIEVRPTNKKFFSLSYLWQPALYAVVGTLVALGSYWLYIIKSGNPVDQFGSSFTSALLWDRLLPNAAFPPGILLGILMVSAPLVALLWIRLRVKGSGIGFWRFIALLALLLVFFGGGLVVSVKIGGGTNLHNLDAYMVLLLVLASCLAFGRYATSDGSKLATLQVPNWLLGALVLVPVGFAVLFGSPIHLASQPVADDVLAQIQAASEQALAEGGQVLFISQRHLLTFNLIHDVPLVPEYEKLFLMEMAISHNDAYLAQFDQDIDRQRFTLIITDPLYNNIEDDSQDTLAPENNAWVREITRPILCAYEPVITFDNPAIQLLKPKYGNKCNQ